MSVRRSPTGGSQPDLSNLSCSEAEPSITIRKRKVLCDIECSCSEDIRGMRLDISRIGSLLEKYIGSNEQILKNMQENITDIKNQITDMKSSNDQTFSAMQTKMESIESEMNKLKISSISVPGTLENQLTLGEKIIQEMQYRSNREKNIVLVGLPEQISGSPEDRISKDEADVHKTVSLVSTDIPKPSKVFRIGKLQPGKHRNVKVCFETTEPAKKLLRNRNKLPHGQKMFSDQTPAQQNYMKNLREELKDRQERGETDLTIKYINGTPTIIKNSKN